MQVSFNNNDGNGITIPKHYIGNEVLLFDYVKAEFSYGVIIQIQLTKTANYQTIAYEIQLFDNATTVYVSENLVFTNEDEAKKWINNVSKQLS
jgi:hypothetical protein